MTRTIREEVPRFFLFSASELLLLTAFFIATAKRRRQSILYTGTIANDATFFKTSNLNPLVLQPTTKPKEMLFLQITITLAVLLCSHCSANVFAGSRVRSLPVFLAPEMCSLELTAR
jgi:hypothetical protein